MFKSKYIVISLLLLSACTTTNPKKVIEKSEKVQGKVILVHLEHKRLVFYLQTIDKIILCHAYNENNTSILKKVEQAVQQSGSIITLYGTGVIRDEEYLTGIDFIATTIEFYDPVKQQKIILDLNYGDRIKDAFSFRGLVKQTLKTVTDKAVSAVK